MIYLKPQSSPALINRGKKYSIKKTLSIIFLPIILIILVLGSILMGVATPTEAASFGAVGAIVLSFIKKKFSSKVLSESILDTY